MVKRIRKPSARQTNKEAIAVAKKLKQRGILSPQVNLHGGRFLSYPVLRKVQALQHFIGSHYTTVKVPKDFAKHTKEQGYTVVRGNHVIVPKDHDFIKKIKAGVIGGVRPIRGGQMLEVNVPFNVSTVADLMDKLENDDFDYLKKSNEHFTFSFFSEKTGEFHMSRATFSDSDLLRKYLERYKAGDIPFKHMKTFRLRPEDTSLFLPENSQRQREAKIRKRAKRRAETEKRGYRYPTYIERMEISRPVYAEKLKRDRAEKARTRREKEMANPAFYEKIKEAARLRAKKSRDAAKVRKGK